MFLSGVGKIPMGFCDMGLPATVLGDQYHGGVVQGRGDDLTSGFGPI